MSEPGDHFAPAAERHQGADGDPQPPRLGSAAGKSPAKGGQRQKVPRLWILPPHLQPRASVLLDPTRPPRQVRPRPFPCPGFCSVPWHSLGDFEAPSSCTGADGGGSSQTVTKRRSERERGRPGIVAKDPTKREGRSTHWIQPQIKPGRRRPAAPSTLLTKTALTWIPRWPESAAECATPAPARALFTLPLKPSKPAPASASPKEAPS